MVFKSWQIDSADSKLAEILQTGLRSVMDPELGLNIIQLGLVRNVEILEDKAHVTMIFTTPFCPYAPQLMETCRSTSEELLGIPTTIEMGREVWDRSFMEDGAVDWGLY